MDEITFPEGLCDLESFWLRASMIGGGEPCPFQLHPGICLTTD
jgi:hypothetical protein